MSATSATSATSAIGTLSSPGIGSGLDVNGIVTKLIAIEQQPITDLQTKQAGIQAQLSSFGLLQSYVTNIHDISDKLAQSSFWGSMSATSFDPPTSVSATTTTGASAGSYQVNVTQLAKTQTLASSAYVNSSATVGSGTLHIQIGSWNAGMNAFTPDGTKATVDVSVAAGDSLDAITTKINSANAGVTASVVTDASGARLVLSSSSTGAGSAVRITASDGDGNNTDAAGLSALAFDPATSSGQMTQMQTAQNALATVNGLTVTSSTNTLAGVIAGVTLTLSKQTTSAVQVNVSQDTASISKSIHDFVDAFNAATSYIKQQTAYDASTKKGGPLQADTSTLSVQSSLRNLVTDTSTASSVYANLSSIGLEMQKDGTLKVNDTKLSAALAANPGEVAKLFDKSGATDTRGNGFALRMRDLATQLTGVQGTISTHSQSLQASIKRNQDQQQEMQDRVALIQARLTQQYSALDTLMAQMNTTNSTLTQSITALQNTATAIAKG